MTIEAKNLLPDSVLTAYANRPEGSAGNLLVFNVPIEEMTHKELKATIWFLTLKERQEREERILNARPVALKTLNAKPTMLSRFKHFIGA